MPTKKSKDTQEAQSERFKVEVQRLTDAGELNPTEAEKILDRLTHAIDRNSKDRLSGPE